MKSLKKIRSGFISRQISIGKLSLKASAGIIKGLKEEDFKERIKSAVKGNVEAITGELHLMKGPIMKAGQMLSMYAGEILPPETRKILESLENQSFYLEWEKLKEEIPKDILEVIEFSQEPLAAASLGQVHRGEIIDSGEQVAVKVQYRGVRAAVDNDVRTLKYLLKALKLLPKTQNIDEIFSEIKEMLKQETDYENEVRSMVAYKEFLGEDSLFKLPEVYQEYSRENLICLEFIDGVSLRNDIFLSLTQKQRDIIGTKFLDLFLKELFEWGIVQTDAHLGNYLYDPRDGKIALLDFGACKKPEAEFLKSYRKILRAALELNKDLFFEASKELDYFDLEKSDPELIWEYFSFVGEPFIGDEDYDWGKSEIPDKVLKMLPKVLKETKLSKPPGEGVFIDRKVAGVFFFLKHIGANVNNKNVFKPYLYK